MTEHNDPRVDMWQGVGPEITAIIVADRERTAATAISVMDRQEKELEALRAEVQLLRSIVSAIDEARTMRKTADSLIDRYYGGNY